MILGKRYVSKSCPAGAALLRARLMDYPSQLDGDRVLPRLSLLPWRGPALDFMVQCRPGPRPGMWRPALTELRLAAACSSSSSGPVVQWLRRRAGKCVVASSNPFLRNFIALWRDALVVLPLTPWLINKFARGPSNFLSSGCLLEHKPATR